ncbi:hypothetical protein GB937_007043 [Aspergillus fischeri]|nr:hypothetical protein GB937_007043 [Aspergillus fischeri]
MTCAETEKLQCETPDREAKRDTKSQGFGCDPVVFPRRDVSVELIAGMTVWSESKTWSPMNWVPGWTQ